MKRTVLKILLAIVILLLIGGCVFLIWMAAYGGSTENREVVSTWYSVKPYNNTITLYDNGTYTSLSWGTPDGTYAIAGSPSTMTD